MLKISLQDKPNGLHLTLEGKLIPPWTSELELVWHQMVSRLDGKKLHIDLCGITFVDQQGMHLLQAIVQAANPEMEANSPLTRQFAEQARNKPQA